jgi:hypothetical protein
MANRDGWRWFDSDPDTKTTQWFRPEADGGYSIYTEQDVGSIVEHNKAKQSMGDGHVTGMGDWLYASIPNIFVLKFLDEHGVNVYGDKEHIARTFDLLNQPEYRWLKNTDKNHTVSFNKRHV